MRVANGSDRATARQGAAAVAERQEAFPGGGAGGRRARRSGRARRRIFRDSAAALLVEGRHQTLGHVAHHLKAWIDDEVDETCGTIDDVF